MLSLVPPFEQPIIQQFLFDMLKDKGTCIPVYILLPSNKYLKQQQKNN